MLELKNVSFGFSSSLLFDDISFSLEKGESIQLIGENGCGKTTLLNCISQFLKIQKGDILFNGNSIIKYEPHKLYKLGIRRLFQDRLVFDNISVKDQLLLVHNKKTLKDIIDIFPELDELLNRNTMKLSGGEKMIVALSMNLKTNEKLLILDEPFNGLSTLNTNKIINLLNKFLLLDVSIIIVDHNNIFKTTKCFKM